MTTRALIRAICCRRKFRLGAAACLFALGVAARSVPAQELPPSPIVTVNGVLIRFAGGQFSLLEREDIHLDDPS